MLSGFKQFVLRGNVVDLAVGVVIGAAFGSVVTAFTKDLLTPLIAAHPDNPGLVHYVIHACDNPAMARDGLAAARYYGEIAPSGPHAVHMPGHIFARLGMWQDDIAVNRASVADST